MDPGRGCVEELLSIAKEKEECLQASLHLTKEMLSVLDGETPEQVENLLEERQEQFSRLEECNREYDLVYLRVREDLSPEGFSILRDLDEQCIEIVRSIQAVDKQVADKMQNLLLELRQRISGVNAGKKGLSAYNQHQQPTEGVLLDEKK